jgi:hypothetical protein
MHRSEYVVNDTWFTIGMRGSGSNTMVTENLRLPENRVITFEELMGTGPERDQDATFGRRLTPHLTMSTTIQSPSLGAAYAALDYTTEIAPKRGITYTDYKRQIDSGAFVHDLGAAVDCCFANDLRSPLESGDSSSPEARLALPRPVFLPDGDSDILRESPRASESPRTRLRRSCRCLSRGA